MKKVILLLALTINVSYAAVYMNENKSGGITYSDTPTKQSKEITIPTGNTITAPPTSTQQPITPLTNTPNPATSTAATEVATQKAREQYKSFKITSPKNEETISNQAVLPITMKVEPNIQPGDKIQLMLDGRPVGTPTGATYQELGVIDRGTHQLYANIISENNRTLKRSNTITIFIHRNSILTSPANR